MKILLISPLFFKDVCPESGFTTYSKLDFNHQIFSRIISNSVFYYPLTTNMINLVLGSTLIEEKDYLTNLKQIKSHNFCSSLSTFQVLSCQT